MKERLHEFGLKLEYAVAATTYEAIVVNKFSKSICYIHHLCLARGSHLVGMDFLYAGQDNSEDI